MKKDTEAFKDSKARSATTREKSTTLLTVSGSGIFVAEALEIEPRALGTFSKHRPTELQAGYTRPVTYFKCKGETTWGPESRPASRWLRVS